MKQVAQEADFFRNKIRYKFVEPAKIHKDCLGRQGRSVFPEMRDLSEMRIRDEEHFLANPIERPAVVEHKGLSVNFYF
ncbi:hypothetical protein D9M72_473050 [compost metagenome]